jgi:ubiquinone biosynthesis protein COQ4
MVQTIESAPRDASPPPPVSDRRAVPSRRIQWRRGWRALRAVLADPERTDKVIEFLNCTGGDADLRAFARFRATAEGRRLLAERPSLLGTLSDLEALASLPPGSLGRAYADFMRSEQLAPDGIVSEFRNADTSTPVPDPEMEWFFERMDTMHDLWHVLTGYGRDEAGEVANLAFTLAQFPTRGLAILTLAAVVVGPKDLTLSWPR